MVRISDMKNILITGGAGFLGSNLIDHIFKHDNKVKIWCLDNLYTGSIKNIEHLKENKRFVFIDQDVCHPISLNIDFHEIYNLACPASPVHYQKDPIITMKTCFLGAMNTLNLARKCNAKILHASTSEVYGDPLVHPQHEGYWGHVNPIGIRSCYDEGKRAAETLMFDFDRTFNMAIKVVRIFNTYGPKMDINDGRVVSNFIVQALENKDITIYGDGTQTRSFCYVADLVSAIYKYMKIGKKSAGPFNIGNPKEFSILELAQKVIDKTGSSSKIIFQSIPEDDPKQRKPDISLARSAFDWEPIIDLDEGLHLSIPYFKKALS